MISVGVPGIATKAGEYKRVALASWIGTSVEWYDYNVYSIAAALVIGKLFFPHASTLVGTMAAFATFAVGFIARPLGGILAGHFGDRIGRKRVMIYTLLLMGGATTLIGLLPTYAEIGVLAPILLVVLRLLQGLSAGGEWGGAALMAVEHAPADKRGLFGNFTQLGTPAGMFLADVIILATTWFLSKEQFESWGWRIPFLLSFVMVFIGYLIRTRVAESPVFEDLRETGRRTRIPVVDLFRSHTLRIVLALLSFLGNIAVGFIFLAFITAYGTHMLHLGRNFMLSVVLIGCVTWFVSMIFFAAWSDRIGRRRVFLLGYGLLIVWAFPFFALFSTADAGAIILGVVVLTLGLAATFGPQAALFAELFPAKVRSSGASISYAIGACLGGGFSPLIATALLGATGTVYAVSVFMMVFCAVSFLATLAMGRYRSTFETLPAYGARL